MGKQVFIPRDEVVEEAFSVSQLSTFLRCRKAWDYRYKQRITRVVEKPYLTKGKLLHAGMASAMNHLFYKPGETVDELCGIAKNTVIKEYLLWRKNLNYEFEPEEIENYNQMVHECEFIVERTIRYFNPDKWEVLDIDGKPAIELHYMLPIRGMKRIHGFIDLVAKEKETGFIWQIDWKFKSTLSGEEDEQYNIQNAIYSRVLKKAGIPIVGSLTFQSLNIGPTLPSINKNGSISRAKIRCPWDLYAKFCVEHEQNPEDYAEEMIPKLADIEWCRVIKEYRSDYYMEKIWNDVVTATSYGIACKRKNRRDIHNIHPMTCRMCEYATLCQAELRGYDVEDLLSGIYMRKPIMEVEFIEEEKE